MPTPAGRFPDLPLTLPGLVMRRAALVALAGVLAWALVGLGRMRDDVDQELAGARALASLFERVATASALADDAEARRLLAHWRDDGATRHLQVQVRDGQGATLLQAEPMGEVPGWLQPVLGWSERWFRPAPTTTVRWPLPRPDGSRWSVAVTAAPQSERAEALGLLATGAGVLAVVAAGMLLVMAWNTRRAFAPLARLLAAIGEMGGAGDGQGRHPGVRVLPPMPVAELETIARALRELDTALELAQAQRQQLARRLLALQEDERAHLARELHDEFGQRLTALRANAAWLQRRLADDAELAPVARDIAQQGMAIQQDVRAVLARLRPPMGAEATTLQTLGEMLLGLAEAWPRGALARPELRLQLCDAEGRVLDWAREAPALVLPESLVLALYRISQEALTNVSRHAQAQHLSLQLLLQRQPGAVRLAWAVQDDGAGIADPAQAWQRGSGLAGIKQRLWALGAELRIEDAAPGTRLCADWSWPLENAVDG